MRILDLFFPRQAKCIFCSKETSTLGICDDCYEHMPFIKEPTCDICGGTLVGKGSVCIECKNRTMTFDKCYCILEYRDEVRSKIIALKQNGKKHIAETFAYLVEDKVMPLLENIDIIIPVPIHEERVKERGFNQSEVLCKNLQSTGKVNKDICRRIKNTPHQTGLGRDNRESNLVGAFEIKDKKQIKDKTILIVDDIYTTGSTLNEIAKTLYKCKAKKVIALCLARTPVNLNKVVD